MRIVLWGEGQKKQRKVEWGIANTHLKNIATGTELHPRHIKKLIIKSHPELVNVQFHRFFKGEHGIYAVHSKQLAAGAYGCVYYCEDIHGIPWVLKVTLKRYANFFICPIKPRLSAVNSSGLNFKNSVKWP